MLNVLKLSNDPWVQTCKDIDAPIKPQKAQWELTVASHGSQVYATGKWDIVCKWVKWVNTAPLLYKSDL